MVFDSVSVQILDHITYTDYEILLIAGSRIILHANADIMSLHRFIIKLTNGLECSIAFELKELIRGGADARETPLLPEVICYCLAVGISNG